MQARHPHVVAVKWLGGSQVGLGIIGKIGSQPPLQLALGAPFSQTRLLVIFESLFLSGTTFCAGDCTPPEPEVLGPNSGKQILDARILDPNSWVEFSHPAFFFSPAKRTPPPRKFTLKKFTSQNSRFKIQPRNRAKENSHCTSAGPFSARAPLCCKTCGVRPVFAPAVGKLWAPHPSKCPRAHEAKC